MNSINTDSPQPKFPSVPNFAFEQELLDTGISHVCGIDEAGRGPLAGPVVAAAVILDPQNLPDGLQDSKKITAQKRDILFDEIIETAWVSIASISAKTIDQMNIRAASLYAMKIAANALENPPGQALIDGNAMPQGLPCPATTLIKGDGRSMSIAAASIIAKVTRDKLMVRMGNHYPEYGFAQHKGYPTKAHRKILLEIGPCPLHRMTFAPVKASLKSN